MAKKDIFLKRGRGSKEGKQDFDSHVGDEARCAELMSVRDPWPFYKVNDIAEVHTHEC